MSFNNKVSISWSKIGSKPWRIWIWYWWSSLSGFIRPIWLHQRNSNTVPLSDHALPLPFIAWIWLHRIKTIRLRTICQIGNWLSRHLWRGKSTTSQHKGARPILSIGERSTIFPTNQYHSSYSLLLRWEVYRYSHCPLESLARALGKSWESQYG